ncbi:UNKNOWN [Stylonychia lemnae]|uniref:Uncharacterized protein n=1 Tax=Stylonychia lemnae TaxID=5949 RepID=A0A077ZRY5_STYLE|nr:UNKNOWN [Stylonychia lemnae]|eukprot:CDW72120.1 UNKNOWN [Stylonychia lemnae]
MTTISDAFGVSNLFSLPIDHSCKDSTSDSSKRSRRESVSGVAGVHEEGHSGHSDTQYEDPLFDDEGLLESYTKIWESFNDKDLVPQKVSKSPNLSHSCPFYNQVYSNSPSNEDGQYLSDVASWMTRSFQENIAAPKAYLPPAQSLLSPAWCLSGDHTVMTLPPRAKANSFGFQATANDSENSQKQSKNGVGAHQNRKEGIFSALNTPPKKVFSIFSKQLNPEDDTQEENWEEDTNDTEIMKNINSLLDSGNPQKKPQYPYRTLEIVINNYMLNEALQKVSDPQELDSWAGLRDDLSFMHIQSQGRLSFKSTQFYYHAHTIALKLMIYTNSGCDNSFEVVSVLAAINKKDKVQSKVGLYSKISNEECTVEASNL